MLSGMASSNLYKKDNLYYCPLCIEEDIKKVGEPYFHRKHQLEGVMTCHKHGCYVKAYKPYSAKISTTRYIRLTRGIIDNSSPEWPNKETKYWLNEIALMSESIVSAGFKRLTFEKIHGSIRKLLNIRGYITKSDCVRQSAFCSDLKNFYGDNLFKLLHSDFSGHHYDWPRELAIGPKHTIHPIRYILVIRFLSGSMENAKRFFLDDSINFYEISNFAAKRNCKYTKPSNINTLEREEQYLNEIKDYIQIHPRASRKKTRDLFSTQYSYLYWRNKEALYSALSNLKPSKIGRPCSIDWAKRDEECLSNLKRVYADLKKRVPPIWLSKNKLVNSLKYKSVLLHLDKLPKTNKFLLLVAEDVSDFRLRRIEFCCRKLLSEKGYIRERELLQAASITMETYGKLESQIQNIITSLTVNMMDN